MTAQQVAGAADPVAPSSWGALFRRPFAPLTVGLVVVEATTGMQYFAVVTVLPAVTRDLHGRSWYGVALAGRLLMIRGTRLAALPAADPGGSAAGQRMPLGGTGLLVAGTAVLLTGTGAPPLAAAVITVGGLLLAGAGAARLLLLRGLGVRSVAVAAARSGRRRRA